MASALVQKLRYELALSLRWAARLGLSEGIDNHFSAVVTDERFLINPLELHWSEIRPKDLVEVEMNTGEVLTPGGQVEITAMNIHRGIHMHKPNAKVVLHTHMPFATTLTCLLDGRIDMIHQNSLRFYNRIAYDDEYSGLALALDEGIRMAKTLGEGKDIVMLGNHGTIVCGPTVGVAFDELYFLERTSQLQVYALSSQKKLRIMSDEVVKMTAKQMQEEGPAQGELHFKALGRILDKEDPNWQNK